MTRIVANRAERESWRRSAVIDTAEREYAARGWDHITVEQIAKRAHISRALLYIYFRDRGGLHLAIVERALTRLSRMFREAEASGIRGENKLEAMARAFTTFASERPHQLDACLRFHALRDMKALQSAGGAACLRLRACTLGALRQGLESGYEDGTVPRALGDPDVVALSIWAFLHGSVQMAHMKARASKTQPASSLPLIEQSLALLRRMLHCSSMTS
jgi:AcrR family transcriptional regulator